MQGDSFCTVDLPESWRTALADGRITLPDTDRFYPTAVASDGSRVFGELYSDAWSGVVAVDRRGMVSRIRAFGNPLQDQISAAFDGRWLVWEESHSVTNWSDWDIRAWDSSTGEVFDIATAPRVNGAPVSGPFVRPVVSQGKAAWVQANQSGKGELHLYDLAQRKDHVIAATAPVPPVLLWGSKLLWAEKDSPAGGHLGMADAATGDLLPVPEPLASITSIASMAASDDLLALSENYHTVSIWHTSEREIQQIFVAGQDDQVDWLDISGDIVIWIGLKAAMAADLRSGSVAPIGHSDARTDGDALLVLEPVGPIVKPAEDVVALSHFEIQVVDATKLPPLPDCPS